MGFIGDFFGGSSQTAVQTSTTSVDVTVNPQIGVGVEIDTAPIGAALTEFSAASEREAALIASGLAAQGASFENLGATQAGAIGNLTDRFAAGVAALGEELKTGFLIVAAGLGLYLLMRRAS